MNTIRNWLDRKEIQYSVHSFGANYFNDHSLDLHFEGIQISFGIGEAEYKDYKDIKKYCERYGYSIIQSGGFPGHYYINIMRRDQWQRLKNYDEYSRASQEQCQKHIHFCYQYYGKTHKELNEELTGIMEFYEEEYKKFLAA